MEFSLMTVLNIEQRDQNLRPTDRISSLEEIFQTLQRPDRKQRREIAKKLDLDRYQVKNWFQYKRRKVKNAKRREVNTTLRTENKKILEMNMKMKEALKNGVCKPCRDSQILKELRHENERLKERIEKMSKLLLMYEEKQEVSLELKLGPPTSSSDGDFLKLGLP
ncbi:hypothetical protein P8452_12475 [Trifolium repens]|nr:hypothetical protein P8452_12475 [Trifolium repens]